MNLVSRNTFRNRKQWLRKAQQTGKTLFVSIALIHNEVAFSQTCSLPGSPIINESFGAVNQYSSLDGRTTYRRTSSICPNNGEYKLTETVTDTCFNYAWHKVTEDHTPNDTQGQMLIINASTEAGVFYQQSLSDLCGGSQYEFSVWCLNLLKPGICSEASPPNLTMRVETESGQLLQTINFGAVTVTQTPIWRQFSALFTAPTSKESVVIKLFNREAGGCGNDLALDDIQLRPCGECQPTSVFVPDVFTPNNDRVNDKLDVYIPDAVSFDMKIYDRWGSLIFVSNALQNAWDGDNGNTHCPSGAYTWTITYSLVDSANVTRNYTRTGQVLLLR